MPMTPIAQLIDVTKTYFCLDCGVCTGSCPVARVFPDFSPRQIVERALYGIEEPSDPTIWSCLTCAQCSVRCPASIDFPEFVRRIRDEAHAAGYDGTPAHNGMLQTISAIQTLGPAQRRTSWAADLQTCQEGEVLYFVGCRPYFDVIFRDIDAGALEGARRVVKMLNACGVTPVLSPEECCCGHDALWNGDEATFGRLAERNLEAIRKSGAKQVVFSCPEGYYTFMEWYPRMFGPLGFQAVLLLDFLAEKVHEGVLKFRESEAVVTYHDPCRLGRLMGMYDAPREILKAMPGLELREMPRSRENGVCCGTSGWQNCGSCAKEIQVERLGEARDTGAGTLITACPKCQIHFRCARKAFDLDIEIVDLYELMAERTIGA